MDMKKQVLLFISIFMFSITMSVSAARIVVADQTIEGPYQGTIAGPGIEGYIYYDSGNKVLIMNNATINAPDVEEDHYGYWHFIPLLIEETDITVKLLGDNVINSTNGIYFNKISNCTFYGGGSLTINISHDAGINAYDVGRISFSNCSININVRYVLTYPLVYGISASSRTQNEENHFQLCINNADLIIHSSCCLNGVTRLQLIDCFLYEPFGAYFNPDSMTILNTNNTICPDLQILSGHVGVPTIEENTWRVWGNASGIHVEDAEVGLCLDVFNILGQNMQHSVVQEGNFEIPLRPGVYIVKIGNHSQKVVVN